MMNPKVFVRYYVLSRDGSLPEIKCKIDENHLALVPFFDEKEEIVLRCYDCNYKLRPGLKLYKEIINLLEKVENV